MKDYMYRSLNVAKKVYFEILVTCFIVTVLFGFSVVVSASAETEKEPEITITETFTTNLESKVATTSVTTTQAQTTVMETKQATTVALARAEVITKAPAKTTSIHGVESTTAVKTTAPKTTVATTVSTTVKTTSPATTTINTTATTAVSTTAQTTTKADKDDSVESDSSNSMKSLGNFRITFYCGCSKCNGKWAGQTASGAPMVEGKTIAVDTRVIPMGTSVYIEGLGWYVAQDTGSAIKGKRIDVYISDHSRCMTMGVLYRDVFVNR